MTSDQALLESDVRLNSADKLRTFSTSSIEEYTQKEATTTSKAEEILERLVEVVPYRKNAYSAHWLILKQKELKTRCMN